MKALVYTAPKHAGCAAVDPRESESGRNVFELVIDAVGTKATRLTALERGEGRRCRACTSDCRMGQAGSTCASSPSAGVTLIGSYTYSTADMRATVDALYRGIFGDLAWVEERALAEGAHAFADLDRGRSASAKIVLRPH